MKFLGSASLMTQWPGDTGGGRKAIVKDYSLMKYINYGFLLGSIIFVFIGLYNWLARSQIDYSAFFLALAALGHSVYVHSTKADKSS
jgi:hypothetical protein